MFWEELIAYFPRYDMNHIENNMSDNSTTVARVIIFMATFLLSCCLAMIGGFLQNHYQALSHDDVWGSGGMNPPFLTLALDEGEWSASLPGHFTNNGKSLSIYWIGDWVHSRASLAVVEKKNSLVPAGNQTPAV
jgi:hypothetical protein